MSVACNLAMHHNIPLTCYDCMCTLLDKLPLFLTLHTCMQAEWFYSLHTWNCFDTTLHTYPNLWNRLWNIILWVWHNYALYFLMSVRLIATIYRSNITMVTITKS